MSAGPADAGRDETRASVQPAPRQFDPYDRPGVWTAPPGGGGFGSCCERSAQVRPVWKGNGVSADLSVDVGRRSLAIDVVALDEFRARLPTRIWIEAVPSEQRVGSLAPDARIRDAGESALVACQEPARRGQVDTDGLAVVTGGRRPVPS